MATGGSTREHLGDRGMRTAAMNRVISTVACVGAVLWAGVASSQPAAPEYVGYVVRVSGSWTLTTANSASATTKATQWLEVPAGSRMVPAGSVGEMTIMLINGRTLQLDAARPETWKTPISMPASRDAEDGKWMRLAMRWLSAKPQVVVPAMARGTTDAEPISDRVIEWSAAGIDATAIVGASQQAVILRFDPLDSEGARLAEAPIIVDWEPAEGRRPSIPVRRSLYRVVVLDPQGSIAAREAWILVVTPAAYGSYSRLFEKLKQSVAPWAGDDPRSARGFLRAALLAMAGDASGR
jgi:hypothetical protein